MRLKAIRKEAAHLVNERGAVGPLEALHREMKQAKREKNRRLEPYQTQVAVEVSRRSGSVTVNNE